MPLSVVTAPFSLAAAPPVPAFDLAREVALFYRDHPKFKDKLYFMEADEAGNRVVRAPADFAAVEKKLRDNRNLFNSLAWAASQGLSFAQPATGYSCIVIDRRASRKDQPQLTGTMSADAENFYVLDHEIGHAICRDGLTGFDKNIKECAADSYAVIRHIQRFGVGDIAHAVPLMRAVELVFRADNGAHFSTPVLQKILEDSARFDFRRLNPQQTAELANRYAVSYTTNARELSYLRQGFAPFTGKLGKIAGGETAILQEFARHVLKTKSDIEFKWGSLALQALLDGKTICNGKQIAPQGPEWDKIRQSLARRAKAGEGVFFGLQKTQAANGNRLLLKTIE